MIKGDHHVSKQKIILNEDKEMIEALEQGGYETVPNATAEIERYKKIFQESGNKVKRVNIRMKSRKSQTKHS